MAILLTLIHSCIHFSIQNDGRQQVQLTWNFTFPIWKCVQLFSSNGFRPCMTRLLRKRSSKLSWNHTHTTLQSWTVCNILFEYIPAHYCHVPYCSQIHPGQVDHSATEHYFCSQAGTVPGLTVTELALDYPLKIPNKRRKNLITSFI